MLGNKKVPAYFVFTIYAGVSRKYDFIRVDNIINLCYNNAQEWLENAFVLDDGDIGE